MSILSSLRDKAQALGVKQPISKITTKTQILIKALGKGGK
jgi:hypothetical protein